MTCVSAIATPIAIDGSYHEFVFGEAPGPAIGCLNQNCSPTTNPVADTSSTSPWTFTGPATLFVLDLGHIGDVFGIFDNNVSLGTTSAPSGSGNPCGFDIACSVGTAGYSRATVPLGAGDHSLTFSIVANAPDTESGSAVFSVSSAASAVPETSAWVLVGSGLVLLGAWRRRLSQ